ncbi:MAG: DUF4134 domain-containing protein [Prevotellaceae bacterium]|jgi:hypothetical protein|nr:DUF4134 domain-containing protein [Prevotellaceae bacterium]
MKNFYKRALALSAVGALALQGYAQDFNAAFKGFTEVTNQLKSNYAKIQGLVYIIAAVLFAIGLIQVIPKFQAGDQNATKHAIAWATGILVLIGGNLLIKTVFTV